MSKSTSYQDVRESKIFGIGERIIMSGIINGVDGVVFAYMPYDEKDTIEMMKQFGVTVALVRSEYDGRVGKLNLKPDIEALGAES